jgi:hypothetical protein
MLIWTISCRRVAVGSLGHLRLPLCIQRFGSSICKMCCQELGGESLSSDGGDLPFEMNLAFESVVDQAPAFCYSSEATRLGGYEPAGRFPCFSRSWLSAFRPGLLCRDTKNPGAAAVWTWIMRKSVLTSTAKVDFFCFEGKEVWLLTVAYAWTHRGFSSLIALIPF